MPKSFPVFTFLILTGLVLQEIRIQAQPTEASYATGHVLIKFRGDLQQEFAQMTGANVLASLLDRLNLPPGAGLKETALSRLFRQQAAPPNRQDKINLDYFMYLHLPPALRVDECCRRLKGHPAIDYVEPDGIGTGGTTIPNDPNFPNQWHHQNSVKPSASIKTPEAWDFTQGTNTVVVAVLDTGVNTNLSEFAGRTVPGYNFVTNNTNTADDHGHGTAVSGVLCANANNNLLVAGVDWRCRLMPIKVLDQDNSGFYSWFAQGVDFAVANGAKVINLSAGGSSSSTTLTRAITNAIARGVIFVTITHNNGTNVITFPGNLTNCITVGATDQMDRRAGFSNYGPQIDLVAPGTNIYTVGRSGTLQFWWGTSFAAPQVAGVSALLCALRPTLTHDDVRALLCAGAEDQVGDATDTPGFDNYHGWGRLNALNSLLLARTTIDPIVMTNNVLVLSWRSPANASNRQPYVVELRPSFSHAWTAADSSNVFHYLPERTYWTNVTAFALTNQSRFFRVRIRQN